MVFESAYQLYFLICVYAGTAGNVEHGVQYQLKLVYEHNLQRTACNMTYGTFGGVTGRDDILNALFGCMLQFLCAGDSHGRRHEHSGWQKVLLTFCSPTLLGPVWVLNLRREDNFAENSLAGPHFELDLQSAVRVGVRGIYLWCSRMGSWNALYQ